MAWGGLWPRLQRRHNRPLAAPPPRGALQCILGRSPEARSGGPPKLVRNMLSSAELCRTTSAIEALRSSSLEPGRATSWRAVRKRHTCAVSHESPDPSSQICRVSAISAGHALSFGRPTS